jgi:hypothetical protein
VVGPSPGSGEAEAPLRSGSSLSSEVEVESEPRVGRGGDRRLGDEPESEPWGRARQSSTSSGAEPESEPWGRARRSLSSSGAEAESEPWGQARWSSSSSGAEAESEPWGRARRSSSSSVAEAEPWVGRGGVRRLPEPRLSLSPGSGEAEFVVRGRDGGRALGSGEAELPMAPEAGLGCCQPHSVERHSSRSDAGGAVLLLGRSVERRSDCGHFGSVD